MKQFEYKVIDIWSSNKGDIQRELNRMGENGWELIGFPSDDDYLYTFKREKVNDNPDNII